MKIEAIIFDLDGTLLNTIDDIADSMNLILSKYGFPPHLAEDYKKFVGDGIEVLVSRALSPEDRKTEIINNLVDEFKKVYSRNWNVKTKVYDGIEETLSELHKMGYKLAILSNKREDFTKAMVKAMLPNIPFTAVLGLKEGIPPKPHPESAMRVLKIIGVPPEKCLYVGDSDIDMKCATSSGMIPVGVLWGFRDEKELTQNGARFLISKPGEIFKILDSYK